MGYDKQKLKISTRVKRNHLYHLNSYAKLHNSQLKPTFTGGHIDLSTTTHVTTLITFALGNQTTIGSQRMPPVSD